MNAELYKEIIIEFLFPFMADKYNFLCKIYQDNGPKHNSILCRTFFDESNINWVFQLIIFK